LCKEHGDKKQRPRKVAKRPRRVARAPPQSRHTEHKDRDPREDALRRRPAPGSGLRPAVPVPEKNGPSVQRSITSSLQEPAGDGSVAMNDSNPRASAPAPSPPSAHPLPSPPSAFAPPPVPFPARSPPPLSGMPLPRPLRPSATSTFFSSSLTPRNPATSAPTPPGHLDAPASVEPPPCTPRALAAGPQVGPLICGPVPEAATAAPLRGHELRRAPWERRRPVQQRRRRCRGAAPGVQGRCGN
jgi:hypothetical protein